MKIYIRSSAAVSAQNTFDDGDFLNEPVEYNDIRLPAIEPDYTRFIDPKQIRRMSHIIKMGVAAAKSCLEKAGIDVPGAIVTGTALGCIEDTVTFFTRLIEMDEELLPPTAFIQSTHNTVAAQIALMLKCHQYNNTFVHKGISFESALTDAIMLLKEGETDNVLTGGTEEMTDTSFTVLNRLGLFRRWPVSNLSLFYDEPAKGTIGGEGATFFLLTGQQSEGNLAEFNGVQTFYKLNGTAEIVSKITGFLEKHGLTIGDIDLVISGKNGDIKNDSVYDALNSSIFSNVSIANYKHLCGDYAVSSAFALWLAANIIKRQEIPAIIIENEVNTNPPKKILIYNHYLNTYHSLMLISAC